MEKEIFIDSHVHIMTRKRLQGLARWVLRWDPNHPIRESLDAENILYDLYNCGVTHFFNLVYPLKENETDILNSFNLDFCKEVPGAIPFASMHPDSPGKVKIAENILKNPDVVGFKFHPHVQRFDPWDERMDPLYAFLQDAEKPVLLHTGYEDFYGAKMPVKKLEGILKQYPKLPIVFVHMAFPEITTVFKMLDDYPQLYLDATNVLACFRKGYEIGDSLLSNSKVTIDIIVNGLEKYHNRIMFGSDHPVGMGDLQSIYNDLQDLPLNEETKKSISAVTPKAFVSRFIPEFDWSRQLRLPEIAPSKISFR